MGITRGLYVTVSPHRLERMKSDIFFAHRLKGIEKDYLFPTDSADSTDFSLANNS